MHDTLKVYLAGPCKFETDGGRGYRQEIIRKLEAISSYTGKRIKPFDPTKYFGYDTKKHKTEKQIMDFYYSKLRKCNIVLLNCNGTATSPGSCMELQYAIDHDIPCIGYGTKDVYPWVSASCQVVFDDMTEALDYIKDYYLS